MISLSSGQPPSRNRAMPAGTDMGSAASIEVCIPVVDSQLPWKSYAITPIQSRCGWIAAMSYAFSTVLAPAPTAIVSRSGSTPGLAAASVAMAARNSASSSTKLALSWGRPPWPAWPGYSQSMSTPSKVWSLANAMHDAIKVARLACASAMLVKRLFVAVRSLKVQPPSEIRVRMAEFWARTWVWKRAYMPCPPFRPVMSFTSKGMMS